MINEFIKDWDLENLIAASESTAVEVDEDGRSARGGARGVEIEGLARVRTICVRAAGNREDGVAVLLEMGSQNLDGGKENFHNGGASCEREVLECFHDCDCGVMTSGGYVNEQLVL